MPNQSPPDDGPDSENATSFLHIQVKPRDKASWVKAAMAEQSNLSQWVISQLNARAKIILMHDPNLTDNNHD